MREIERTHSRQNANEAATETMRMVEAEQNDGSRYYDHKLTQIEKGKLISSLNRLSNSVAENEASPISGYKDKRLLSILQTNTNKFYLHEVVLQKNLLDESIKTDTEADSHRGDVAKLLKDFEKGHDGGKKNIRVRSSFARSFRRS